MLYKRINVELIVGADEAEAVMAELEAAFDRLEEKHTFRWRDRNRCFQASGKTEEIRARA
jgi:cupin superfamily acireductone dioxygenase involved in methionine salvage